MNPSSAPGESDHPIHQPVVRLLRLDPRATLPTYHSDEAAGMDLYACLPEDQPITLGAGDIVMIHCGFAMALTPGYEAQVRPRSGIASKHGITLPNAPGTIDSDYRGEVKVPLINLSKHLYVIEHGLRIAQMVIAPVARARVEEVDALEETTRGDGGFGSTGDR
ncbi:MAG: dUTP diphosphatase [Phycisphaeraceae bacterium]|nr:MAG: dUTP diphosphatase [Phycisphaeraceae bacterium]